MHTKYEVSTCISSKIVSKVRIVHKSESQGLDNKVTDLDMLLSIKQASLVEYAYQIQSFSISLIVAKLWVTLKLCTERQRKKWP